MALKLVVKVRCGVKVANGGVRWYSELIVTLPGMCCTAPDIRLCTHIWLCTLHRTSCCLDLHYGTKPQSLLIKTQNTMLFTIFFFFFKKRKGTRSCSNIIILFTWVSKHSLLLSDRFLIRHFNSFIYFLLYSE